MLDETTTVGLYLTLVGLFAGFFWTSLGTWLRDLVALHAEAEYWGAISSTDADKEKARIKAKATGLGDFTTGLTTGVVLLFGGFLLIRALQLADDLEGDLAGNLQSALGVFLAAFVGLTLFLVIRGYSLVKKIKGLV